ncbi:MAG: hypothetical protein HRU80_08240 [Ignavibacteriales bacterium]|nr:MAG: hypothetical protein HRU80_08240 [Ignavibacteriales bacterium]
MENYSAETSRIAGVIALLTVLAPPVSGTFAGISNVSANISLLSGMLRLGISQSQQDLNSATINFGFYLGSKIIDSKIENSKVLSEPEKKLTKDVIGSTYNVITNFGGF